MNFALIGCGRIAINHIKAVHANKMKLVAICDVESSKMKSLMERAESAGISEGLHPEYYTDFRTMLDEHSEISLVGIATESGFHAEIALECIRRRVNVIIEKPMAMSMEDADKIVELSKKLSVKVSVCHQNRFNPAVQALHEAIVQGRFGKISHASIHVRWNRNKSYYDQAAWRGTWAEDGGVLMNQCIHGIDLLRWLMGGEALRVYGQTRRRLHDYLEAEDVGLAVVNFASGAIASIEGTSNVYPHNLEETLYVFGEKGTVKIGGKSTNNIDIWEFDKEMPGDELKRGLKEATSNVYGNGHTALFADMASAIKEGREPFIGAEDGRSALEMVLSIYKSQKTGEAVDLPLKDFASIDMLGEF